MKHSISKLCADSLRVYLNDNHNIKLKSGHSHEIVAACFGYKSKISLVADRRCPVDNLENAKFILLDPPLPLINQRLAALEELPADLPPSHILARGIYQGILDNEELSDKVIPNFQDLALSLAKERWHWHKGFLGITPSPEWLIEVEVENRETEVLMTVSYDYRANTGERLSDSTFDIKFPRVAGNCGYGEPEIHPTFYSGQMRDPDFRLKIGAT